MFNSFACENGSLVVLFSKSGQSIPALLEVEQPADKKYRMFTVGSTLGGTGATFMGKDKWGRNLEYKSCDY